MEIDIGSDNFHTVTASTQGNFVPVYKIGDASQAGVVMTVSGKEVVLGLRLKTRCTAFLNRHWLSAIPREKRGVFAHLNHDNRFSLLRSNADLMAQVSDLAEREGVTSADHAVSFVVGPWRDIVVHASSLADSRFGELLASMPDGPLWRLRIVDNHPRENADAAHDKITAVQKFYLACLFDACMDGEDAIAKLTVVHLSGSRISEDFLDALAALAGHVTTLDATRRSDGSSVDALLRVLVRRSVALDYLVIPAESVSFIPGRLLRRVKLKQLVLTDFDPENQGVMRHLRTMFKNDAPCTLMLSTKEYSQQVHRELIGSRFKCVFWTINVSSMIPAKAKTKVRTRLSFHWSESSE